MPACSANSCEALVFGIGVISGQAYGCDNGDVLGIGEECTVTCGPGYAIASSTVACPLDATPNAPVIGMLTCTATMCSAPSTVGGCADTNNCVARVVSGCNDMVCSMCHASFSWTKARRMVRDSTVQQTNMGSLQIALQASRVATATSSRVSCAGVRFGGRAACGLRACAAAG